MSPWVERIGGQAMRSKRSLVAFLGFSLWVTALAGDAAMAGVNPFRPDGKISVGSGTPLGDNIYTSDATDQVALAKIAGGKSKRFSFYAQNDGGSSDSFTWHGCSGNRSFVVKHFDNTTDVTADVTSVAGFTHSGTLFPGAEITDWFIKVKAKASVRPGARFTCYSSIISVNDGALMDMVAVKVRAK